MERRRFRIALSVAFVLTIGWISLGAQAQFASFTGTVLGSDGNPVPGVEVVATNEATQVAYTAKSNDQGLYTIATLPIGTYVIRANSQKLQAVRDESNQAGDRPDRACRYPAAGGRDREGRSHRHHPHPADPERQSSARSSRRRRSSACRSTGATSRSCRCCCPAS